MFPMNESCTVSRPVKTSDGRGGYTQTLLPIAGYECRISSPSASDRYYAGKAQEAIDAVIYTYENADIRVEDHIFVRGDEYIALPPTKNSIAAFLRVGVKHVKH